MFNICVTFTCLEGKREKFVEKVRAEGILEAILAEDGCERYDYYYSEKNENELMLIETWQTEAHQKVHLEQPHMAKLRSFKNEYISDTRIVEFSIV